jgi:hypothetical protein
VRCPQRTDARYPLRTADSTARRGQSGPGAALTALGFHKAWGVAPGSDERCAFGAKHTQAFDRMGRLSSGRTKAGPLVVPRAFQNCLATWFAREISMIAR